MLSSSLSSSDDVESSLALTGGTTSASALGLVPCIACDNAITTNHSHTTESQDGVTKTEVTRHGGSISMHTKHAMRHTRYTAAAW